jgi:uncharacterized protein (DUF58 family)
VKRIWDPEIVARASNLHIRARQLIWGFRFGLHRSPKIARSIEFAEHKEYAPGDPVRDIDWKVYGRTERLLVKRQQADTELSLVFVLDASADMALGDRSYPDWDDSHFGRAATLIASLAMLAQRRGERVGLLIMGGSGHDIEWLTPRSSKNQLVHLLNIISSIKPKGSADLRTSLAFLSDRIPKRSIVYIFSDCMEEPKEWGPNLCVLAAHKIDLRLIHLFSDKEFTLDFDEVGQFLSTEYSSPIALDTKSIREDFAGIVDGYRKELAAWCGKSGSLYIPAPIEIPLMRPFVHMMKGIR